jgi:hypothetical protein
VEHSGDICGLVFFLYLSLKLLVTNLHLLGILEIHPEDLQPIAEKQGEDSQDGGDGDHNPGEGVF